MQNKDYKIIVNEIEEIMKNYFQEKIGSFALSRQRNEPYVEFSLEFNIYNFYHIFLNYDRGCFGCAISYGGKGIPLKNSQKWYEEADLNIFVAELDKEIRLRIPNKFLEYYGWL